VKLGNEPEEKESPYKKMNRHIQWAKKGAIALAVPLLSLVVKELFERVSGVPVATGTSVEDDDQS